MGFGVRRTVEFDHMKAFFEAKGHEVILVEVFDQGTMNQTSILWSGSKEQENGLERLMNQKRKVWVVGFSMGGVIASILASEYRR